MAIYILFSTSARAFVFSANIPNILTFSKFQKNNIYYNSAKTLEKIADLKYIIFNYLGVLTEKKVKLLDIVAADKNFALEIAASLEKDNLHPHALEILRYVESLGLSMKYTSHSNYIEDKGVIGRIGGKNYALGNMNLMKDMGIVVGMLQREKIRLEKDGKIVLVLGSTAINLPNYQKNPGIVVALFVFENELKKQGMNLISELKKFKIIPWVISSDSQFTLAQNLRKINIHNFEAELTIELKNEFIDKFSKIHHDTSIGIVKLNHEINSFSQNNIFFNLESKQNTIGDNSIGFDDLDISKIIFAIKQSKRLITITKQNFYSSLLYNMSVIIFSFLSYDLFKNSSYIPIIAILLSNICSMGIILNSKLQDDMVRAPGFEPGTTKV